MRLKNVIHHNYIHETQQAAMCNYVLAQKKLGIQILLMLKEIPNNIMNIIPYLQDWLFMEKNKIEPTPPQSTSLYIKSNIIKSHLFLWLRLVA